MTDCVKNDCRIVVDNCNVSLYCSNRESLWAQIESLKADLEHQCKRNTELCMIAGAAASNRVANEKLREENRDYHAREISLKEESAEIRERYEKAEIARSALALANDRLRKAHDEVLSHFKDKESALWTTEATLAETRDDLQNARRRIAALVHEIDGIAAYLRGQQAAHAKTIASLNEADGQIALLLLDKTKMRKHLDEANNLHKCEVADRIGPLMAANERLSRTLESCAEARHKAEEKSREYKQQLDDIWVKLDKMQTAVVKADRPADFQGPVIEWSDFKHHLYRDLCHLLPNWPVPAQAQRPRKDEWFGP